MRTPGAEQHKYLYFDGKNMKGLNDCFSNFISWNQNKKRQTNVNQLTTGHIYKL